MSQNPIIATSQESAVAGHVQKFEAPVPSASADSGLVRLLDSPKVLAEIRKVAAQTITPERLLRMFITAVRSKADIARCTTSSVLRCAMQAAQFGVEPDGRHAHLIAFGNELTFIIDWKGLVLVGRRNGVRGIVPELVYEADLFKFHRDETGLHFRHEPDLGGDRGEIIGAYCFFIIDDVSDIEYMSVEQMEAVRLRSRAPNSDAWANSRPEMYRKTVVKRASKRWPLNAEVASVLDTELETSIDTGMPPTPNVAPADATVFAKKPGHGVGLPAREAPPMIASPFQRTTAPKPEPAPEPAQAAAAPAPQAAPEAGTGTAPQVRRGPGRPPKKREVAPEPEQPAEQPVAPAAQSEPESESEPELPAQNEQELAVIAKLTRPEMAPPQDARAAKIADIRVRIAKFGLVPEDVVAVAVKAGLAEPGATLDKFEDGTLMLLTDEALKSIAGGITKNDVPTP